MFLIRSAKKNDCFQVARIHCQEIKWGFLSQLGEKFLYYFYEAMTDSPNAFLIIAKNNNSVIGFISGCTDLKKFYQEFVRKYILKVSLILLKRILNLRVIKKIFEIMKYSKQNKENLPEAELLSIAVSKEFQGSGVAQKLLEKFFFEMKERGIKQVKVIIGENLPRAVRFYEKSGFKFYSRDSIHKDTPSRIYTFDIKK